jgi:ribosomal protein S18 acetylase RimI-like enzyme
MIFNEFELSDNYESKPDLVADSPLIYFKLLTKYQIAKSKYIQVIDRQTNQDIFNCVIYCITDNFNNSYMKLPYKIKYEIADIIISENFRSKGYGTIIMNKILTKITNSTNSINPTNLTNLIFLWTTSNNHIAIGFYKKLGFEQIPISKKLDKFYRTQHKWISSNQNIIGFIF